MPVALFSAVRVELVALQPFHSGVAVFRLTFIGLWRSMKQAVHIFREMNLTGNSSLFLTVTLTPLLIDERHKMRTKIQSTSRAS